MRRRQLLKSLFSAAALPFLGKDQPTVASSFPVSTLGKTYFTVNSARGTQFREIHPGKRIYLDGKDVYSSAFEFDLEHQWVGVWRHRFLNEPCDPPWPLTKIFLRGKVEIR